MQRWPMHKINTSPQFAPVGLPLLVPAFILN